jgi:XTP/dITP diphosphohydrolase
LEKLKLKEGRSSVLEVPKSLPTVIKKGESQRSERSYFDWDEPHQVWEKVQEELEEKLKSVQGSRQD